VVTCENVTDEQHKNSSSVSAWVLCTYFLIAVIILGLINTSAVL
jgi:hypothetical protein